MIKYAETYYEGEEIDGFYVTGMMKRSWAADLEVLLELDRICKKNGIKYFLLYGSLLGAIRHKGFIPWDDDIDVGMLREDYIKFISIVDSQIVKPFMVGNTNSDSVLYPCRIVNAEKPCVDDDFLNRFHGCPYIAGVDIFPLDNISDNPQRVEEFKQMFQVTKYASQRLDPLWDEGKIPLNESAVLDHPEAEELEEIVTGIEEYFGIKIPRDDSGSIVLAHITDELAQIFNDEECNWVADMSQVDVSKDKIKIFPKAAFDELIEMEFQGIKFPVPVGYESVLESLYGKDWRIPQRGVAQHCYPSYKLQAQALEKIYKECNVTPPDYFFL